jgi:plastocyanin
MINRGINLMRYVILGLILASLILSGCVIFQQEQNVTNETAPPPPPPPPPKAPTLSIVSPVQGDVITIEGDTTDVTLALSTQNFVVKSPGGSSKAGEGHFRVTVDNEVPLTVTSKTYDLTGLGVGDHTVKVELVNNDRTLYSPNVRGEVTFAIERAKPKEYEPQEYTVSITDAGFDPASLDVKVGDMVTWINDGKMPQTATCFVEGKKAFDTGSIASGKSVTIRMDQMLECEYYSQLFRALSGTINVQSNGSEVQ